MPQQQLSWEPITKKEMLQTENALEEQYKTYLIKLMSFKDGIQYELDNDFMKKYLEAITPAVISAGCDLNFMATPTPTPTQR